MSVMWQNAPAIALENGNYDGITTVAEMRTHGDLAIGAFDQLDGELLGLDGVFYQVTADGRARPADDDQTVPFCVVSRFVAEKRCSLPEGVTHETLPGAIDATVDAVNLFWSFRFDAHFVHLRTRSLPRQTRPFPKLAEVVKTQPEYEHADVEGTIVGFRSPGYVGRVDPPGYHFHFISADRTFGGHVLSFESTRSEIALERIERLELDFPTDPAFTQADLV